MTANGPTTAGNLEVSTEGMQVPSRPVPLQNSLTAAAERLTSRSISKYASKKKSNGGGWQAEAWEMYDLVGEEHFLATTLSRRMGQAHLFIGKVSEDDAAGDPVPVEPGSPADVLDLFGRNETHRSQMITRAGVGLFVPGEMYFVGVPPYLWEKPADGSSPIERATRLVQDTSERISPDVGLYAPDGTAVDMTDLEWFALSNEEVSWDNSGQLKMTLPHHGTVQCSPDDVILIHSWSPHPRLFAEPDSPTRAALPILRELSGLTEHVSAQIDSRLAGAGILLVRKSLKDSMTSGNGDEPDDVFIDALMDAMITPISDRSNASAYVPLVVTVPNDGSQAAVADYIHHLTVDNSLDSEARELREEAIRRLALSQDTPPEILLGLGSMNHWGAWLVREDVIVTHVEPPLALLCDALTREFLWPVLMAGGMSEEEAEQHVLWYSVDHLISRPNQAQDAKDLYDRGELSGKALRRETGFSDEDAPELTEEAATQDTAVTTALSLVAKAPTLLASPGLPALVAQIRAVLNDDVPAIEEVAPAQGGTSEPPAETSPEPDTATDGSGGTEDPSGSDESGPPNTSDAPADPEGTS